MKSIATASRRSKIGMIGPVVAVLIGFAIPSVYALLEYRERAEMLSFKANLIAERAANYIYGRETLWQYQVVRLEEILQLPHGWSEIRRHVGDSKERTVFDSGEMLKRPLLNSSVPIVVGSTTVGHLHVSESLAEYVDMVRIVFLTSFGIAAAAYIAFRALPLRILDDTISELKTQNTCLDVALGNMSQGLCLFGKDQRLVMCNQRYADLYELPSTLMRPGTPLQEIIRYRVKVGKYLGAGERDYAEKITSMVKDGIPSTEVYDLRDGTSISVKFRPLSDGGWVATHEDVTEQRRAEARIAYLAHHDLLTALPNRAFLRERLEEARWIVDAGGSVAVLCLDLDQFKDVNGTLGHTIGDALLREIARRLRSCVKDDDTIARVGGDGFAIIQVNAIQPQAASVLAARTIEAITAPLEIEGHRIRIGASVGIAVASRESEDAGLLLKNAEVALYQVKGRGKSGYAFFDPDMDALVQRRRQMEIDLRTATSNGDFELYYQPLLNLDKNRVGTFEALLRWRQSNVGMVSPADFIPVAEETGLIIPIGEWVLRAACAEAASWPDDTRVSVNLSPAQFQQDNLLAVVLQALADANLPADRLELEITESILLENTEATLAILRSLREAGVRIAMDDFGIGFSSMRSISVFPFDKIKLDQSFVTDFGSSERAGTIIEVMAMLGRRLNITVTAEGVETEEQLAWLRSLGVSEVQGYLISRPSPASQVASMLKLTARKIPAAA